MGGLSSGTWPARMLEKLQFLFGVKRALIRASGSEALGKMVVKSPVVINQPNPYPSGQQLSCQQVQGLPSMRGCIPQQAPQLQCSYSHSQHSWIDFYPKVDSEIPRN